MKERKWALENREVRYDGFYRIDRLRFRHDLHDGGETSTLERELFVRGNVVGVLPYDPATDRIALVEQFRLGAMDQQPDPWMVEIIAGMIDTDESPEQVAVREAREEAGLELESVQLVSHYLASPGASNEEVFVFYAETDLSGIGGLHGLPEEDEDILVRTVPLDEAFAMMGDGRIRNALSIIALQWLRLNRPGRVGSGGSYST